MLLMTDIHVRVFSGVGIRPYIHSIAKLRNEVLKDYPYFQEPNLNEHTQYLKRVCVIKESLAVLIFDNTTLVGVSLGYPLSLESSEVQQPFRQRGLDPSDYYFFSESVLLKPYRGRGIGHHFFDAREAHALHFPSFKHICFCVPLDIQAREERPIDFVPLHDFWRKRGYVHHPHMQVTTKKQRIEQPEPIEVISTVWIKDLHP